MFDLNQKVKNKVTELFLFPIKTEWKFFPNRCSLEQYTNLDFYRFLNSRMDEPKIPDYFLIRTAGPSIRKSASAKKHLSVTLTIFQEPTYFINHILWPGIKRSPLMNIFRLNIQYTHFTVRSHSPGLLRNKCHGITFIHQSQFSIRMGRSLRINKNTTFQ